MTQKEDEPTQAKFFTTDNSDWPTNCPEYTVAAVRVGRPNATTDWQECYGACAALAAHPHGRGSRVSAAAEKLLRTVNQIARKFDNLRGHPAKGLWAHMWHFWHPSMRETLVKAAQSGERGQTSTASAAARLLQ